MSDAQGPVAVLADIVAVMRRERLVLLAGSVAYFTFISMVPLLLLLVVTVSLFASDALAMRTVYRATGALAPESTALFREIIFAAVNREQVTVVSAVVLLWGALLTFRALNTVFAGIYQTHLERSFLETVTEVLLVLGVITLSVLAMVVTGVALSVFVTAEVWSALGPLVLFVTLTIVFLPLYYILPDVNLRLAEVAPGTVFAAGAWTILQALFGYYSAVSSATQFYGAASAFLLTLVWLYVGGFVLLLGAVLNAVLAGRADPDVEWVPAVLT